MISYRQGKILAAKEYLQEDVSLRELNLNNTSISSSFSYMTLMEIMRDMENYDEAKMYADKMMEILNQFPQHHEILGRGISQLATLAHAQDNFSKAEGLYRQALDMMPPEGIRSSFAQLGYGQLLLEAGRSVEAQTWLLLALDKRREYFPDEHSALLESQILYGIAVWRSYEVREQGILPEKIQRARNYIQEGLALLQHHELYQRGIRKRMLTLAETSLSSVQLN